MPRRILLLITDLQIGGTPTVVRELALRLRSTEVEVEVACLAERGPVAAELIAAGVVVTALYARSAIDLPRTIYRLIRLIRTRDYDTVFSFLVHANACAAMASAFCPAVRFIQSIQTTQPNPAWHWRLQRMTQVLADKVVVPSPAAGKMASVAGGVPTERVVVIPNAVSVDSFDDLYDRNVRRLESNSLHRYSGLVEGAGSANVPPSIQIGFIGRLDPIKRIPALIAAMPLLIAPVASRPSCHLHIYGEGADRPAVEAAIHRFDLHNHVTLHGVIARPHDALSSLDLLVLPSAAEGFGLVLIEAMSAGVPVVAAASPGITDVIVDGRNGVLFPTAEPMSIARAIERALAEPLLSTLVRNGRQDAETKYSWPRILAAYRRMLGIPIRAPLLPGARTV